MKPSERIDKIAEEGKFLLEVSTSQWDYIRAIKSYLDEQAENEAKAVSYPIIKEIK